MSYCDVGSDAIYCVHVHIVTLESSAHAFLTRIFISLSVYLSASRSLCVVNKHSR